MASQLLLKDINELFLQCSICSNQLKEPKQLSCLHRFCRACLKGLVKEEDKKVRCPSCRDENSLPENGVDGLKTDFNTQNIVEAIQLQASAKSEPLRICIGCTKKLEAKAYCFRCCDFLCHGCRDYHVTSMIVKDHRPHVLTLSDIEARSLTLEELSSMREAPRCHKHPEKVSELCYTTCGNLPVCMLCTYGAHKGHALQEVESLAVMERENHQEYLGGLMKYEEEEIHRMRDRMNDAAESLARSLKDEKKKLGDEYSQEESTTKEEIRKVNDRFKERKKELNQITKEKESQRKQEFEKGMKELQDNYDNACKEDQREFDVELNKLHEGNRKIISELDEKLRVMSEIFRKSLTSFRDRERKQGEEMEESAKRFDGIIKKFENVAKIAASIIAAKHDWTDVHCISDVLVVIDSLMAELKDPERTITLLGATMEGFASGIHNGIEEESVVDIEGIKEGDYGIDGVVCSDDGTVVITRLTSRKYLLFIVVTMKGKLLKRDEIPTIGCFSNYCDMLSRTKIATAGDPCQIGIYDIRSGKYVKTDISRHKGRDVWFAGHIAADPENNWITVSSCVSRKLYVLNDKLQLVRCLKLPECIQNPIDICIYGDNLVVCESKGRRAFVVTARTNCKVVYEFTRPDLGGDWRPCLVRAGKSGSIYMLWTDGLDKERWIIVHYSPNSHEIMATSSVGREHAPRCMTTVTTDLGEKLLLVTGGGQIHTCAVKLLSN